MHEFIKTSMTHTASLSCPTCARPLTITRYRCEPCNLSVEGSIELPPLAKLSHEEQSFVTAFVRSHGSIKRMEAVFGISYPTVKNKLNAISRKLDAAVQVPDNRDKILDRLQKGEITVPEALKLLEETENS